MMDRIDAFTTLHVPGDPLVLYNIWDAGSARAVAAAAPAATTTAVAAAAGATNDDDPEGPRPPSNLCCPITLHLFRDPVLCVGDGETYVRSAIEEHIRVKQVMLAAAQEKLDATNGESNEARRAVELGPVLRRAPRRLLSSRRAHHGS